MTAWDALLRAAALLDACPSAEVVAAREVIARAAEHAASCLACTGLDAPLLAEAAEVVGTWSSSADIDLAAVELAHELELTVCRLTTHQVPTPAGPPTCGNSASSHGVAHLREIGTS